MILSVLVRDGITYSEFTLHTTLQAKAVTISTSKTITIYSLYLPPSENLNIVLLSRLIDQLPTPFVICGDINGYSKTWGYDKNNSRENRIHDFITDNNICLIKDGSYTYLHPATGTFTTIFLCVLLTFLWRLILWLNRIHMVVIFLLLKRLAFRLRMHYSVEISIGLTQY